MKEIKHKKFIDKVSFKERIGSRIERKCFEYTSRIVLPFKITIVKRLSKTEKSEALLKEEWVKY